MIDEEKQEYSSAPKIIEKKYRNMEHRKVQEVRRLEDH
jgi:hypothetical protein